MTGEHETCLTRSGEPVSPSGLIVIDKPPGPTSFDCIRFLRKTCNIPPKWKMGHLGTLDPFASGVMVIALGKAVRYADYALKSDKKYRARLWLGDETDTLDPTGKIVASKDIPSGWVDRLTEIESQFCGVISQVPPAYSAKQVNGKRAYKAARQGFQLELKPVDVEIYSIILMSPTDRWVDFIAHVSGGTYIRSLARDIAHSLGTVGHLLGLERIASGPFPKDESIPFSAFELGGSHVLLHHLRGVDQILSHLSSLELKPGRDDKIRHGIILTVDDFNIGVEDEQRIFEKNEIIRIDGIDGCFIALGKIKSTANDKLELVPFKPWV
jgi:tRNA pseudouridine55 synthase